MDNSKDNNNNNMPVPYEGDNQSIFISYAHLDADRVLPIIRRMWEDGYRIWYDEGIPNGSKFDPKISDQIKKCGCLIAFFSENYYQSLYGQDELFYAKKLNKQVLFVHLDDPTDIIPSDFEMVSVRYRNIDYYKLNFENFIDELYKVEGIKTFDDTVELKGEDALAFYHRLKNNDVGERECQKIIKLDLSNNWIKRLTPLIGRMTNLQVLNLTSNTLRDLPSEFEQLVNLRELNLSSNSFRELPMVLSKLPKLVSLNIGGNYFSALPLDLGKFEQLETFDIYRNWFDDLPPQIGDIKNLKHLDASYNKFKKFPVEICALSELKTLDLNSTLLSDIPAEISQLKNLVTLDISYNKLEKILPLCVIKEWYSRGISFLQIETDYNIIMETPGINLFETEIKDFSKQILLTNNLEDMLQYYKLLGYNE